MRDTLFLGYQSDVAPFYAAFDALVLPSANEGTPVSAIEALAAGRPVVATRVGGVPDVVRDGEDGFLWREPAELEARTLQLIGDDVLRARLGRAARASSRRFASERFGAAMLRALEPVLSAGDRRSG